MVGGEVVKVECLACGSVHKFRPLNKPARVKSQAPVVRHARSGVSREEAVAYSRSEAARKAAVTRAATRAAQEAQATEVAWKMAMSRQAEDSGRAYDMNSSFVTGEVISHPKFGLGEVREVTRPNKMEVLFQDGLRVLRCVC